MNKRQLEVEKAKLTAEEKQLKHLKAIYKKAADDITKKIEISNGKISVLLANWDELTDEQKSIYQSQIYQRDFQKSLQKQIDGFLKDLNSKQYKSVDEYLKDSYKTGYIGAMYDIAGQGIPIVTPIDQKQVVKAMTHDTKLSKRLYTRLGEDVDLLKKRVANNISRGIATADSYQNIARNIANGTKISINRTMTIARTEGNRIHVQAADHAQHKAKEIGADVVKQWCSALDGRTRPHHRQLDGQIREIDEPFEVAGMKVMYPLSFGIAAEDINCRCALLQRAKWNLGEEELETLKERAAYFGLDKTKDFEDYKKKYMKAADEIATVESIYNAVESYTATKQEKVKTVDINKTVKPNQTARPLEEINKSANKMVWQHWDEYRKKYIKHGVDISTLDFDADKTPFGFDTVKLANVKPEVAEKIVETVDNLQSRFYSPLTSIETLGKEESILAGSEFAITIHQLEHGTAQLRINPVKVNDKGIERLKELGENGYHVKIESGKEVEYLITHEFAHSILNIGEKLPSKSRNFVERDFSDIKKARKELEPLFNSYMDDLKKAEKEYDDIRKPIESKMLFGTGEVTDEERKMIADAREKVDNIKISKYSLVNYEEFMAEAFTDAVMGTEPKEYSVKVYEVINKYFGK